VQVSNVDSLPEVTHPTANDAPVVTVVRGEFFTTTLHHIMGSTATLSTDQAYFHTLTCIAGEVTVSAGEVSFALPKGQSAFIPAAVGMYTLNGDGRVLRSWQGTE